MTCWIISVQDRVFFDITYLLSCSCGYLLPPQAFEEKKPAQASNSATPQWCLHPDHTIHPGTPVPPVLLPFHTTSYFYLRIHFPQLQVLPKAAPRTKSAPRCTGQLCTPVAPTYQALQEVLLSPAALHYFAVLGTSWAEMRPGQSSPRWSWARLRQLRINRPQVWSSYPYVDR